MHSWDDAKKLDLLPLCLSGIARDAFDALSETERATFASAEAGLKASFSSQSSVDSHAALRDLRFDGTQSLDLFVIELKKLITQTYGTATDALLYNTFLSTLSNDLYVAVVSDGVTTFDAAVTKVRNLVTAARHVSRPVRQMSAARLTPPPSGSTEETVARLERRISELEAQLTSRPTRARGPRTCFACGEVGHIRPTCVHRDVSCATCGRRGHLSRVCSRNPTQGNGSGPAQVAEEGPRQRERPQLPTQTDRRM